MRKQLTLMVVLVVALALGIFGFSNSSGDSTIGADAGGSELASLGPVELVALFYGNDQNISCNRGQNATDPSSCQGSTFDPYGGNDFDFVDATITCTGVNGFTVDSVTKCQFSGNASDPNVQTDLEMTHTNVNTNAPCIGTTYAVVTITTQDLADTMTINLIAQNNDNDDCIASDGSYIPA